VRIFGRDHCDDVWLVLLELAGATCARIHEREVVPGCSIVLSFSDCGLSPAVSRAFFRLTPIAVTICSSSSNITTAATR
jgi:hypothetical protein